MFSTVGSHVQIFLLVFVEKRRKMNVPLPEVRFVHRERGIQTKSPSPLALMRRVWCVFLLHFTIKKSIRM